MPDSTQPGDRPRALIVNLGPRPVPIGATLASAGFLVTETPVVAAIVEAVRQAWPDVVVVACGRHQRKRASDVLTVLRGARIRELIPVVVVTDDAEYAAELGHTLARLRITVLVAPDDDAVFDGVVAAVAKEPALRPRE